MTDDRDANVKAAAKTCAGEITRRDFVGGTLVGSGVTARLVRKMLPKAHIATVYAKPDGRDDVDTFVTIVSRDTWIVFPWDQGEPVRPGG